MSRSQHDLSAKEFSAHNFVIWNRILQLFYRNDHHIETTCFGQIWVATLKAKVTAWPCSKIVSGPKLCNLKSDFTTTFDKLLLCFQYLFGEHFPVPTGSCLYLIHLEVILNLQLICLLGALFRYVRSFHQLFISYLWSFLI